MKKNWVLAKHNLDARAQLVSELGILPITAQVILNRGIASPSTARSYLSPSLSDIPDPFMITDMDKAVARISKALTDREKIAIFGDYDVDGITGTALLASFFGQLGTQPIVALPDRMREGYGLTIEAIDDLHSQKASLIITVDNGTRALKEIDHASALGIDVVVTDHHSAHEELPRAVAIVNPQRDALGSAHRHLSGCGVAFMLALALRKSLRGSSHMTDPEPNLRAQLDLVALGTIADVVPLVGANRVLVRHGLGEIEGAPRPGLAALMEVSSTSPKNLSPDAVAFQLGPRINAAGRLGDARLALDLLLCRDPARSMEIARALDRANRERQRIEGEIIDKAFTQLDSDRSLERRFGVVLHSRGWHIGVIGIVASKIAKRIGRPAAVITLDSNPARGSVRGIAGMNLVEALAACNDLLVRYGGHSMAAGLSIAESDIAEFSDRFDKACARLVPEDYRETLDVDTLVKPSDVNAELISELSSCRPFGEGNPEPVLAIHDMEILDRRIVGEKHIKLRVRAGDVQFDSIGFGMAETLPASVRRASFAFCPEMNTWNGYTSVQLKLKDIQFDSP